MFIINICNYFIDKKRVIKLENMLLLLVSARIQNPSEPLIGSQVSGLTRIIATGCKLLGRMLGTNPTAPT